MICALAIQVFVPLEFIKTIARWFIKLTMPLGFLAQMGLDAYNAYEIRPKVYRYSTMRQVTYANFVFDFLTHFYAFHLQTYVVNQGKYKYWDTQHRLDPRDETIFQRKFERQTRKSTLKETTTES